MSGAGDNALRPSRHGESDEKSEASETEIDQGTARRSAHKPPRRSPKSAKSLHDVRLPNEGRQYRAARDELLRAEMDLRAQVERVATLRRKLPAGGEVPQDYAFEEVPGPLASDGPAHTVKLSDLFDKHPTLVAYSFMYGPRMNKPCPMCTSMLDSLNGAAHHLRERVGLVVIAKSPIDRIRAFARERGWQHLRLLSSAGNSYNRDYQGESADGAQMPMLNVFVRHDGKVHHFWSSEMMFPPPARGQNHRHVDMIWPLWNVLDLTPQGRGSDWFPKLSY
jgi:predicted dithiol-disulfide oxidoreductase (DUF899 family)